MTNSVRTVIKNDPKPKANLAGYFYREHNSRSIRPGQRWGQLIVRKIAGYEGAAIVWECVCNCNKAILVNAKDLKSGKVSSCGARLCRFKALKDLHEKRNEG